MSIISDGAHIYVIDLEYIVSMDKVDPHIPAHLEFVGSGYAQGLFLFSGPKVPRTGGVIIATAPSSKELEAFIAEDPLLTNNLARVKMTEIMLRNMADVLKTL